MHNLIHSSVIRPQEKPHARNQATSLQCNGYKNGALFHAVGSTSDKNRDWKLVPSTFDLQLP